MPVRFENFEFSFLLKGKPAFKPSDLGRRIGQEIKGKVEAAVEFDDFYKHLSAGGHVGALHAHRPHKYFARVDIERFFYSIARNRVARAIQDSGIDRGEHYAKWSCVKNPYEDPSYALPYGFVQSPILATLVLMRSPAGTFLRNLPTDQFGRSVYMDDISLSSDNLAALRETYDELLSCLAMSNFTPNEAKTRAPSDAIDVFNCELRQGVSAVTEARQAEFFATDRSLASSAAFERYVQKVAHGNAE
ncbi:hypothetical protein FJ937_11865 [Mesorhizobium sp. B2-4-4]|uniref:reverse transcriptase domain-containing protein n=1 Tax=Mesorhizobium sp. B2-4-4 TaxID=2589945 RepID=UPI001126351F|nr:reverse transcriptase domain-containing protein [Mesorhizobium sp. B2-4-4]TPL52052.1 hypothetical protein FJ937_11865 [Mesorhizobium sp. B2-4-4]